MSAPALSCLDQLRQFTQVVADTGDIDAVKDYQPQDATTNPSLILKAATLPQYAPLLSDAIDFAKQQSQSPAQQLADCADKLAVNIGKYILTLIPGMISTEIDARLSYDTHASVAKAQRLIALYQQAGVDTNRVLIKLAATWQGIQAAKQLEQQGIKCNLTLLFSFAQAKACADAGVYLISPFVGRIMDWYKAKQGIEFQADNDPGVLSVREIYHYYKQHQYPTIIMGASFRNTGEIIALAGCDKLTISPALLEQLAQSQTLISRQLQPTTNIKPRPSCFTENEFLWQHHLNPMAVEKLAEGIRLFSQDQTRLEELLTTKLSP